MADGSELDVPFVQSLCDQLATSFGLTVSVMAEGGEADEVIVTRWQAWRSKTMRTGCNTALDFR